MVSNALYEQINSNKNELQKTFVPAELNKVGLTFGELEKLEIKPRDEIIRGLGRTENGLLNAVTNVGKSTLIRNMALSLVTGRELLPLVISGKKYRVCIIDTEDTITFLRSDIRKMMTDFSELEKQLVRENLYLICDVSFGDEFLQLNKTDHFVSLVETIKNFKTDIVFVDTISSSFAIRDENNNGEIKENVMKPLKRLAILTNTALMATHHIGKSKLEDGATKEIAHRGRGASAFSDLSRVVFNLDTDARNDVVLSCGKIKGEDFADTRYQYEKEKRWFTRQGESRTVSKYDLFLEIFDDGKTFKRKEIDEMLVGEISISTITRLLKSAIDRSDLKKENNSYSKNAQMLTPYSNEHLSINSVRDNTQLNQSVTKNAQMLNSYTDEHLSINQKSTLRQCQNCGLEMELFTDGKTIFCPFGCESKNLSEL